MYSVNLKKRLSKAIPSFVILRFDIRYSAVRCSARSLATEGASLIEDETSSEPSVPYNMLSDICSKSIAAQVLEEPDCVIT